MPATNRTSESAAFATKDLLYINTIRLMQARTPKKNELSAQAAVHISSFSIGTSLCGPQPTIVVSQLLPKQWMDPSTALSGVYMHGWEKAYTRSTRYFNKHSSISKEYTPAA